MSKLRDAFRKARKSDGGRAMGFAPSSDAGHRSILVGVHVGDDASDAGDGLKAGANFAVVHTDTGAAATKSLTGADAGGAFFGAHVGTLAAGEGSALAESGCAFIVVSPESASADDADQEDVGLVVPVDVNAEDSALQVLARLDLDAALIPEEFSAVTLAQQAQLVRVAGLTGTRLIVRASTDIAAGDLRVLRDSGVGAILVASSTKATDLKALIERIEGLPPRKTSEDDHRPIALGHHLRED